MKVLAFFSLILAVVTSYPVVKTYTLSSLSEAMVDPKTDPGMMPYFDVAISEIMLALIGKNEKFTHGVLPSPSGASTWTVKELKAAIADDNTNPDYVLGLHQAAYFVEEQNLENVEVRTVAVDVSTWTPSDLNEALRSPSTNAALIPYLEKAHAELKAALEKGEIRKTVIMVTPAGLVTPKGEFQYSVGNMESLMKKTRKRL